MISYSVILAVSMCRTEGSFFVCQFQIKPALVNSEPLMTRRIGGLL